MSIAAYTPPLHDGSFADVIVSAHLSADQARKLFDLRLTVLSFGPRSPSAGSVSRVVGSSSPNGGDNSTAPVVSAARIHRSGGTSGETSDPLGASCRSHATSLAMTVRYDRRARDATISHPSRRLERPPVRRRRHRLPELATAA